MGIIKKYHDKKWTIQFLGALYNSIDDICMCDAYMYKLILSNIYMCVAYI
jgi:hypothetical protein